MSQAPGFDDVWTLYHECGHAVAAMAYGLEGWLNVDGVVGSVEIERRHMPSGQANVIYSYAGSVAEAIARLGGTDMGKPTNSAIRDEMANAPPSAEDMSGIGSLATTQAELAACIALLLRNWEQVEELSLAFEDSTGTALYFPHQVPEIAAKIKKMEAAR